MDYDLTPDQRPCRATVRKFCKPDGTVTTTGKARFEKR